jgi:hypothetical protein
MATAKVGATMVSKMHQMEMGLQSAAVLEAQRNIGCTFTTADALLLEQDILHIVKVVPKAT